MLLINHLKETSINVYRSYTASNKHNAFSSKKITSKEGTKCILHVNLALDKAIHIQLYLNSHTITQTKQGTK